tara:strand:- start:5741 stop:7495 length:1755 start_codon:yes stop_codon:yes gene_type:complete
MTIKYNTKVSNILVIGSGGAGLRAAIEAKLNGLSVSVIGKRNRKDVHTVLAAGGINAALGNVDKEDSWQQHFADTYIEGYGIGDPEMIKLMAKEAPSIINEIDQWGANFDRLKNGSIDQRFFGAHTYRRTVYSGDFTGKSILKALLKKAESLRISINDKQYVSSLLVEDGHCFGATAFNIETSIKTVFLADAVILATGGHTRIWRRSSSRKNENTGDGFYLGLKAGCRLIDTEMVQFHPTGMLLPEEIAGTLVTEAVRGEGGKLYNSNGERFMKKYDPERMELSTRDKIAMANYKEIIEGRSSPNGGVYLDISHKDKEFILKKIPTIYRQFIEAQMLDISKEAMEVAPTAHYSMGGIVVNPEAHSTNIQGLYACGEVAGGLHGANRLGGNSLAEILIFGKKAGKAASSYSKNLSIHKRSHIKIKLAIKKIDSLIKNGDEIGIQLERDLHEIMWEYCGVIRDKEKLEAGLSKLLDLKIRMKNLDVRIDKEGCNDLIVAFNLESSILSAEATFLSALKREESRGAHQRSDFPNTINPEKTVNYQVRLNANNQLEVSSLSTKQLPSDLEKLVSKTNRIKDMKGKLLE